MAKFFLGLDLGQTNDYTAIAVLERLKPKGESNGKECAYHVQHLERVRSEPYPSIVNRVAKMVRYPALKGDSCLVIDQTGCGRPVFDMFGKVGLDPVGVSIHGGDTVAHEGRNWASTETRSGRSPASASSD